MVIDACWYISLYIALVLARRFYIMKIFSYSSLRSWSKICFRSLQKDFRVVSALGKVSCLNAETQWSHQTI